MESWTPIAHPPLRIDYLIKLYTDTETCTGFNINVNDARFGRFGPNAYEDLPASLTLAYTPNVGPHGCLRVVTATEFEELQESGLDELYDALEYFPTIMPVPANDEPMPDDDEPVPDDDEPMSDNDEPVPANDAVVEEPVPANDAVVDEPLAVVIDVNPASWVERFRRHRFPLIGDTQAPVVDVILVVNDAPGHDGRVFLHIHAQNRAHLSFTHFMEIVWPPTGQYIWSQVQVQHDNPAPNQYVVFQAHTEDWHALFIIDRAQFRHQNATDDYVHRYVSTWMDVFIARNREQFDNQIRMVNIINAMRAVAADNIPAARAIIERNYPAVPDDDVDNALEFVDVPRQYFVSNREWIKELLNEEHTEDRFGSRCTICLDDFQDKQRLTVGRCGHRLHKDCYARMVGRMDMECPACRGSILRTMSEDFIAPSDPVAAPLSESGAGSSSDVPILRPRGGGLTVDLTSTDVVEIESILEKVVFDEKKYKRDVIKNGNSVFLGAVRATVSTMTYENVEVIQTLNGIMKKYADTVGVPHWTSICININTTADWHTDRGNAGDSVVMVFGNFERGGNLVVLDGQTPQTLSVHNKLLVFDGKKPHMSEPFFGSEPLVWRASVIFYTTSMHKGIKEGSRQFLEECGFVLPSGDVSATSKQKDIFTVVVHFDGSDYKFTRILPYRVSDVKIQMYMRVFKSRGVDAKRAMKDIMLTKWGCGVDNDMWFMEEVCLLRCTLLDDSVVESGPVDTESSDEQEDPVELLEHFEEFNIGEVDEPDFEVTIDFVDVKLIVGVKKTMTISECKEIIKNEAGVDANSYYLRHFDGKMRRTLENKYTLEDYGFDKDVKFEFVAKLGGGGKRARPAAAGGDDSVRGDKESKMKPLRQEVVSSMFMTQASQNLTVQAVRTHVMEMERLFQNQPDQVFQRMFANMTEQQMLKLQEKYMACGNNINQRQGVIAKAIFEQLVARIDSDREELDTMMKVLTATSTLSMLLQFCADSGIMNWEAFVKLMNETATNKSRVVGAQAGAAAAAAAAPVAAAASVERVD
jgi:hypothetical protein